jgi:hypothetical protein
MGLNYARQGFVVAVPSYRSVQCAVRAARGTAGDFTSARRLWTKHPNHIDDVCEALVWVQRHIAEVPCWPRAAVAGRRSRRHGQYGGDPEKIFLSGHSAGGHLVRLARARVAAARRRSGCLLGVRCLSAKAALVHHLRSACAQVSLAATDPRHLQRHGGDTSMIKGVIAISGLYNLVAPSEFAAPRCLPASAPRYLRTHVSLRSGTGRCALSGQVP